MQIRLASDTASAPANTSRRARRRGREPLLEEFCSRALRLARNPLHSAISLASLRPGQLHVPQGIMEASAAGAFLALGIIPDAFEWIA